MQQINEQVDQKSAKNANYVEINKQLNWVKEILTVVCYYKLNN